MTFLMVGRTHLLSVDTHIPPLPFVLFEQFLDHHHHHHQQHSNFVLNMEKNLQDSEQQDLSSAQPSPPPAFPDGGLRAWSVVLGSSIVLSCAFGYLASFGVYENYYSRHQLAHISPSNIAWIGSVQIFFQYATSVISGSLFDLYGAKVPLVPGTLAFVLSIMITSVCKEYYQFLLGQGVLGGLGSGFLFTPAVSVISHHFFHRRGLAIGVCTAGSSIGGLLFPIVLKQALYSQRLGFGWGVRIVGFAILGFMAVACVLVKERLPPRRGKLFLPRAFVEPAYTTLIAAIFFSFWGLWIPYFFIVSFAIEKAHMDSDLAFYTLSIINAGSFFGRIIPGFLADKFGRLNMLVCVYATNSILLLCWVRVTTSAGVLVWVTFFGFTSGAIISLYPASVAQVTPTPQEIGTYMGQASSVVSLAGLTGAPIAGALIRNYGYNEAAIFAGVSMVACTGLSAVARILHSRKRIC
ncbi:putative MFS monocarboxylate transporter [Aspergillus cavernicola]|uniref:MFS monocarboxylate transporter n=1 Tax=Aspergillus cavernicola TaxID=176166 RepID=A0ABR4IK18_9EURO